ncbi:protein SPT2 homolog [Mesoplodon densirostris]|uniref:protein SPT2 homolog n=1 Tax=Mesoplodon densirostris TaxID=48708 RepID=UPI0028DC1506|nr:protein SPT2 homolog [Mesoplodon densirostris]
MCLPSQACRGRTSLGREALEWAPLWLRGGWALAGGGCSSKGGVRARPGGLLRETEKGVGPKVRGPGTASGAVPAPGPPWSRGRGSGPGSQRAGPGTRAERAEGRLGLRVGPGAPGPGVGVGPGSPRAAITPGRAQRLSRQISATRALKSAGTRLGRLGRMGGRRPVFFPCLPLENRGPRRRCCLLVAEPGNEAKWSLTSRPLWVF